MRPDISVCMITYNHEQFILDALNGVALQHYSQPIEVIVGDDASQDRTQEILKSFDPPKNWIYTPILRNKNIGMQSNFVDVLNRARGKYICILEGDDYWTDSSKIKKQAQILDQDPSIAIVSHNVKIKRNNKLEEDSLTQEHGYRYSIKELAHGNSMHTCSVMFRNGLIEKFPESFFTAPAVDYFTHMLNARRGEIVQLNEVMAVYRIHSGGVWSQEPNIEPKVLSYLSAMIPEFEPDIQEILISRYNKISIKYLDRLIKNYEIDNINISSVVRFSDQPLKDFIQKLHEASGNPTLAGAAKVWARRLKRILPFK